MRGPLSRWTDLHVHAFDPVVAINTNLVRGSGADGRGWCRAADRRALKQRERRSHSITASNHRIIIIELKETGMAKGEQKGNRESKKPKKEKIKTIAAAPSQKAAGWQPTFGSGKKK
jgi:hypothetical protein